VVVFLCIWHNPAPSKVIAFSWKLLHNRIPTRQNLARQGVLRSEDSRDCVLYIERLESSAHLILRCDFSCSIWYDIFRWLGKSF
jgi:hypothetical protein